MYNVREQMARTKRALWIVLVLFYIKISLFLKFLDECRDVLVARCLLISKRASSKKRRPKARADAFDGENGWVTADSPQDCKHIASRSQGQRVANHELHTDGSHVRGKGHGHEQGRARDCAHDA